MALLTKLLVFLGLYASERDNALVVKLGNRYKSTRVSSRMAVSVDIKEVKESPEYKDAVGKAKLIVQNHREK